MSTPTSVAGSRRSLARWSVAALATGALVVSGSGLVAFAQSGSGESQGPVFVPADAAGYVEARLDLPAGQDEALAQLMTAFPGFADAGAFDMKVDELIDSLGSEMGVALPEGRLFGDVLTGEVGIALSDLEGMMSGGDPAMLLGLAVADAEAASGVLDALVAEAGEMTETTYGDATIYTDDTVSPPMSVTLYGDWVVIGTGEALVQDSIDVLDGAAPSLAEDAKFTAAWDRLPDARLGAAYMDFAPFAGFMEMAAMMAEGETGMALPTGDLASMMPQDMTASLVAENDRLTLEVLVTPGPGTPATTVGESELANLFPGDTQVYLETRELGVIIKSSLDQMAAALEAQGAGGTDDGSGMSDMEILFSEDSPITAMLGVPLPEFLDFVGDASVGAGYSSDGVWLGIAGEVLDEATAQERVTSLMAILRMFLAQEADSGVSIESADVGGVEVTSIMLPMDQMLSESGVPISVGDSIDVAIADGTLLIGLGDFVENAIVGDAATSLGASEGYLDALAEDTVNSGVMYLNIGSLLAALDPMLAMMAPEWAEISPYATGLDRLVVVGTADDDVLGARMTMIVSQ